MIVTRPSFKWVTTGIWLMPLSFAVTAVALIGAFWREGLLRWQAREIGWVPKTTIGWLWVAVLGLGGVSAACSVRPAESFFGWLGGLGYAITFIVATWTVNTPGRLKQLHKALFWLAMAMAVFGLVVYFGEINYRWVFSPELEIRIGTDDRRINSVMYHPNLFAGYLVLALAAGLGLFHQAAAKRKKVLYALALLTVSTALVLTASRAGWIGAGLMLVAFGLVVDRRWLLVLVGATTAALAFFPNMIFARLSALSWDNPAFDKYRVLAWQSALQMIQDRPFTGFGPGMWPVVYPQYRLPEETHHLPHAHNYYLHVGVEFGVPVVIALFTLVIWVCWRGVRETAHTQYHLPVLATVCGVAGYMVVNMFDYTLSEGRNAMAFFLLVGGIEAARRMALADRPPELRRVVPAEAPAAESTVPSQENNPDV
jgi:putative inorganic carbon (hco3(-)) transporter